MEQHPVPQHIASYEFHLVGDMTLKQFFQVAGGALVALLFYAAPLPGFIKWPVIFLSGLTGVALAFLPFEERPLSIWLVAFIRAIYSPTQLSWQKGKARDIFAPEEMPIELPETGATPSEKLESYPPPSGPLEEASILFEQEERSFLQKMLSLFNFVKPAPSKEEAKPQERPRLVVEQEIPAPPIPVVQPTTPFHTQSSSAMYQTVRGSAYQPPPPAPQPLPTTPVSPVFVPQKRGPGRPRLNPPRFEIAATPPTAPALPNVVVGQVLDSAGNIVESAILEIKDESGQPIRALRTNKVGHFLTATPLPRGVYEIITEKEGLVFESVQFATRDEIIPPIEIRAKSTDQQIPNSKL